MSRISNLSTIRFNLPKYNLPSENILYYTDIFFLSKVIERSIVKKGVSVSYVNVVRQNNTFSIYFDLFYRTQCVSNYRFNLRRQKIFKNFLSLFWFRKAYANIHIVCLNVFLEDNILQKSNFIVERLAGSLFVRRYNLLVDIIKVVALLMCNKCSAMMFLTFLGYLFRFLPKNKHNKFLFFVKGLLIALVSHSYLKGGRFEIGGRLLGKPRANKAKLFAGSVPLQSLSSNIEFSKIHVYTLYGAFGLKL